MVLLPTPSSSEVKERGELSLLSLSAFVACSRLNFTFLITETTLTDWTDHADDLLLISEQQAEESFYTAWASL